MAVDPANVSKGMDVFDADGDKIGTIHDVLYGERNQSGMDQYREAAAANVGTTSSTDDADAEEYTTARSGDPDVGGSADDRTTSESTGSVVNPYAEPGMNATAGSGTMGGYGGVDMPAGSAQGGTGQFAPGVGTSPGSGSILLGDDAMDTGGGGPPMDDASMSAAGGYLHIKEGGLLGLGGKDLYVPSSAVREVVPGDRVTLSISKGDAERYTSVPDDASQSV